MIFAEMCAGTAAVSFALQGAGRTPLTRPGAKTGHARDILAAFGLEPGQGADAFAWFEADPNIAALLDAYTSPGLREAADALVVERAKHATEYALWERLVGRRPRTVAEDVFVRGNAWKAEGTHWKMPKDPSWSACLTTARVVQRLRALAEVRWPEVHIFEDGRVLPNIDASEWYVYIDATYEETTKYGNNMTQPDAVRSALWWFEHGAKVVVSEARPIESLGWLARNITHTREGHVRRWSKQKEEWLTVSPSRVDEKPRAR